MGRVRTKTVKKSAKVIIERYYPKLTLDFETNKRICDEIAIIASKRLRNKIAGYTTHLMKRIQRGPVRGISFKLQEEERPIRPEISALDFTQNTESGQLEVDVETKDLLKHLGFDSIPVNVTPVAQTQVQERGGRRFGDRPLAATKLFLIWPGRKENGLVLTGLRKTAYDDITHATTGVLRDGSEFTHLELQEKFCFPTQGVADSLG
ncbi:40S ribosomal protein S17 [Colletotrichum liriopes]|uniref:40S ribosomal protein S17 n=1 Tax=Colletotrichum liriopes TaxID=708192 RepID=A0AA37LNG0_9PEZI|nr:40S ribosomal protein S17 [Colletotrichum liriopes]